MINRQELCPRCKKIGLTECWREIVKTEILIQVQQQSEGNPAVARVLYGELSAVADQTARNHGCPYVPPLIASQN